MLAIEGKAKWAIVTRLWLTLEKVHDLRMELLLAEQKRHQADSVLWKKTKNTLRDIEEELWGIKQETIRLGYDDNNRLRVALDWRV